MNIDKEIDILNAIKNMLNPDVFEAAVDAIEKQIPMESGHWDYNASGDIVIPCGRCGSELSGNEKYCRFCGQKVKW